MSPALLLLALLAAPAQTAPAPAPHDHATQAPPAAGSPHDHAMEAPPASAPAAPRDESLPAGEAQAKAALDHSPRHGEYVDVKLPGGGAPIRTWVVYPERKDRAPVVLVIHEIFGLSRSRPVDRRSTAGVRCRYPAPRRFTCRRSEGGLSTAEPVLVRQRPLQRLERQPDGQASRRR